MPPRVVAGGTEAVEVRCRGRYCCRSQPITLLPECVVGLPAALLFQILEEDTSRRLLLPLLLLSRFASPYCRRCCCSLVLLPTTCLSLPPP
ncbi:unnamed protein product [Lactuca virosa]|uniref:Uncharacterized protein n=1 Tax=Lactuca virosa TaxID=75947 RepID=A0AAU9NVI3_9ASTR|nr:unnamed protein product [Lactuca virosa]